MSETVVAYFDTNVYSHVANRVCVGDAEVDSLVDAINSCRILILTGSENVVEIVAGFPKNADEVVKKLRLLLQLARPEANALKSVDEVILGDIRAYVERRVQPRRLVDATRARNLAANVRVMAEKGELVDEMQSALEEVRGDKESFRERMREAKESTRIGWERNRAELIAAGRPGDPPTFDVYRGPMSDGFVKGLVRASGWERACRKRGLRGLRDIKSLRMYGDSCASWVYGQTFEGKTPKPSDSADLRHAVIATCASVFVTCDSALGATVQRTAFDGLRILELPEFVRMYVNG